MFLWTIVLIVADWSAWLQVPLPGISSLNVVAADFGVLCFMGLYAWRLTRPTDVPSYFKYFYVVLIVGNIVPLYLGAQNTRLSYSFRDFQVISFSIAFFVALLTINDPREVRTFVRWMATAFVVRELTLLFVLGPQVGYLQRLYTLADPSGTAFIQNFVIYCCYRYFLIYPRRLPGVMSLFVGIYLSVAVLAEGKVGGVLSLAIGAAVFLPYVLNKRRAVRLAGAATLFLVVALVTSRTALVSQLLARVATVYGDASEDPTSAWRLENWQQGLDIFAAHPVFGGGYSWPDGWFVISLSEVGKLQIVKSSWGSDLHNEYLHVLASGGIVGAALLVVFIFSIVAYFIKHIPDLPEANDRSMAGVFFGAFVSFLMTALTNPAWVIYEALIGWAYAGVGIRFIQLRQGHHEGRTTRKLPDLPLRGIARD